MKDASSQPHGTAWQVWGILVLLFLAASVWFGLHPHYRFVAVGLALLILPVLLKRAWTWWIVLLALLGYGAFLWTFRASGYHYTSLLPLTAAGLLLVFRFGKRGLKRLVNVLAALVLAVFLAAEIPILHAALLTAESDAPYVIVLGAAVYGETPSISVRHRSDRAVEHLHNNPDAVAVVSGGQGAGEDISEAECMRRYLVEQGVENGRILLEDRSSSTLENLTFSKAAIEDAGGDPSRVAIVSSSYHLYRAKRMAAALGMAAEGLPSSDGYAVYMTGMYLREAVAVWKLWLMGI
jgi:uncharacterized SAM-binding protein YcdF (DUF218 family)